MNGLDPLRRNSKLQPHHHERLAVVYVRQSSLQQVHDHQESTRLQYALVEYAQTLGWTRNRIVVIDDDQGKSGSNAEGRPGFQRLVSDVTLNHVGLILGIEMSRLARSNRDWHHLLDACALFRTLIADPDGLYDPCDYNDRLLLGLKGTMSEAELHILKGRLHHGKLSKAQRGELGMPVPTGYIRTLDNEIQLDPDEQVQHVIHLIFRKFNDLGTLHALLCYLVQHDIQIGVRERTRGGGGRLTWRRPNRMTLQNILHHPIYAGAYSYGRRQTDRRRQDPTRPATGRVTLPPEEWHVLLRDRVPAYISWDQYQDNLARLDANRSTAASLGSNRGGAALLAGLIRCGKCGRRLIVGYSSGRVTYQCTNLATNYGGPLCLSFSGDCLERWVSEQALRALEPASLELSLEAVAHLEQERADLDHVWQQRLERLAYEVDRAKRQYDAVEPEYRLVVRQLERAWEDKLAEQRQVSEAYDRFVRLQPRHLSVQEVEVIRQLAQDVPALWHAAGTTAKDRKEILRIIIERIVVDVRGEGEQMEVGIHWVGGQVTEGVVARPVASLKQLSYFPELCLRVEAAVRAGKSAWELAEELNSAGLKPPKRRETWGASQVRELAASLGVRFAKRSDGQAMPAVRAARCGDWWTLQGLALELAMPVVTLYSWVRRVEVEARNSSGFWEVRANEAELERLRARRQRPLRVGLHDQWVARSNEYQAQQREARDVQP